MTITNSPVVERDPAPRTDVPDEPASTRTTPGRVVGLDLARGLAVLGMFAAHVGPSPDRGGFVGWSMQFTHGRSSALFAVLAGLAVAILSGGRSPKTGRRGRQARVAIAIRAVVLLAVGTALTMTGTDVEVILAYYGVYFLLALPFTRLRVRTLALVAAGIAVTGPWLTFAGYGFLDDHSWTGALTDYDPITWLGGHGVVKLLLTGSYPATTWLAFVLAGMALGRLDLKATAVRGRLARLSALFVIVGYGGSWLLLHVFTATTAAMNPGQRRSAGDYAWWFGPEFGEGSVWSWRWLLVASPHSGTTFETVGNIGVAVAVIVGCVAATELLPRFPKTRWLQKAVRPVIAVGTMSLTAYVGHIVGIWALGIEDLPGPSLPVLFGFAAGAMVFATLWLWRYRRGPLEATLHAITAFGTRRVR